MAQSLLAMPCSHRVAKAALNGIARHCLGKPEENGYAATINGGTSDELLNDTMAPEPCRCQGRNHCQGRGYPTGKTARIPWLDNPGDDRRRTE